MRYTRDRLFIMPLATSPVENNSKGNWLSLSSLYLKECCSRPDLAGKAGYTPKLFSIF